MIEVSAKLKYILLCDFILLIICIAGLNSLNQKAFLPFETLGVDTLNYQDQSNSLLAQNNINSLNDFPITDEESIEFITDHYNIDDIVLVKIKTNSGTMFLNVRLTKYYTTFFLIVTFLTALLFFIISVFVLIKKYDSKASHLFHWSCIGTALIMCTTWGNLNIYPPEANYLLRFIFHSSYTLTAIIFMNFAFVFPRDRAGKWSKFIKLNYFAAFLLALISSVIFIINFKQTNSSSISNYLLSFSFIRIYAAIIIISSVIIFFIAFLKEKEIAERKKIKWVLLGFIIGPLGFIFFWVLPKEFFGAEILSEHIIILLELSIPITFAIAIIKYHVLDIDQVLNRSMVYGIVISLLLVLYSAVIGIFVSFAPNYNQRTASIFSAIIMVLLLQPIKSRVQRFVDKKFFKVQYNFRKELNRFVSEIKNFNDVELLGKYLINEIGSLIPVEKIALGVFDHQNNKLTIKVQNNFDGISNKSLRIKSELIKNLSQVAAVKYKTETGADTITISHNTLFHWGINLVIPIKSVKDELYGFILLGNKKSGFRYSIEDLDLLKDIGINAGQTIERIKLQEQLISEKIEVEKLEELNQHKSMFVSTVSHDLKTPLTSIKIFSEMILENEKLLSDKSKNHLEIIEGETNRLTRLIDNVLDFSKIEKGVKEYSFRNVHLNEIVKNEIIFIKYMIKMNGFNLSIKINDFNDLIYADEDAVIEALENIISNSIRFSTKIKLLQITTYAKDNYACVVIEDSGIGIDQSNLEKIFTPYFRADNTRLNNIGGTGLGLSIVKQIIDKHNGKIFVKSELGKGSVFSLCFPIILSNIETYNDKDINN